MLKKTPKKHRTTPRAWITKPSKPIRAKTTRPPPPEVAVKLPPHPGSDRPWRCACGFGSRTAPALREHVGASKGKSHTMDPPRGPIEKAAWKRAGMAE